MKLQINDLRTDRHTVVSGTDEQIEARLRLMFPGATGRVPEGHLGNVIQAVARVGHIGVQSLEGAFLASVAHPVQLGLDDAHAVQVEEFQGVKKSEPIAPAKTPSAPA